MILSNGRSSEKKINESGAGSDAFTDVTRTEDGLSQPVFCDVPRRLRIYRDVCVTSFRKLSPHRDPESHFSGNQPFAVKVAVFARNSFVNSPSPTHLGGGGCGKLRALSRNRFTDDMSFVQQIHIIRKTNQP